MQRILITGAAGQIGRALREGFRGSYALIRLLDVAPLGASLTPLRGTDSIMWTVKYRNGQMKRCKNPIRTTQWGSIAAHAEAPAAESIKSQLLYGEPKYLHIEQLPAAPQAAAKV